MRQMRVSTWSVSWCKPGCVPGTCPLLTSKVPHFSWSSFCRMLSITPPNKVSPEIERGSIVWAREYRLRQLATDFVQTNSSNPTTSFLSMLKKTLCTCQFTGPINALKMRSNDKMMMTMMTTTIEPCTQNREDTAKKKVQGWVSKIPL